MIPAIRSCTRLTCTSIAAMAGSDQLKSAWKSNSMTIAKTANPHTRWVSTRSARSVHVRPLGGLTLTACATAASTRA